MNMKSLSFLKVFFTVLHLYLLLSKCFSTLIYLWASSHISSLNLLWALLLVYPSAQPYHFTTMALQLRHFSQSYTEQYKYLITNAFSNKLLTKQQKKKKILIIAEPSLPFFYHLQRSIGVSIRHQAGLIYQALGLSHVFYLTFWTCTYKNGQWHFSHPLRTLPN